MPDGWPDGKHARILYAILFVDNTIKVGTTANLRQRVNKFGAMTSQLLSVIAGGFAEEKALKRDLARHLVPYETERVSDCAEVRQILGRHGLHC